MSDFPIKFTLNFMKDYNDEVLNASCHLREYITYQQIRTRCKEGAGKKGKIRKLEESRAKNCKAEKGDKDK
jgi:hypothetical protein